MIDINKTYRTRKGLKVRILCTDLKDSAYPVVAVITEDGEEKVFVYDSEGTFVNGQVGEYDLVEYDPMLDLKVDDKVLVRFHELEEWIPRHFAEITNGKICTFSEGRTSWSSNGLYTTWKYWKLPD